MDKQRLLQLLASVPKPPGEKRPAGVSDAELDAFFQRVQIPLPPDLREWLKVTNGPCVGPGGLFGIKPARSSLDIEGILSMYPSWRERKWIPVAGDGCGNYYVIGAEHAFGESCPVFFVDTISSTDTPAYIVASDLEHFLVFLLEGELGNKDWPFNRLAVTHSDPKLMQCTGAPLPWTEE